MTLRLFWQRQVLVGFFPPRPHLALIDTNIKNNNVFAG